MKKLIITIAFLACAITSYTSNNVYANDTIKTQNGNIYNWYRSSWMFYITSWSSVTNIIVYGKKDVTTQACDNPEIVTTCKTDEFIRKQLADLIAQSEYSCINTSEIVRLSTLLNNTKQEVANKCTIIKRKIETETIVPALKQIIKVKWKTRTVYVPMMPNTWVFN